MNRFNSLTSRMRRAVAVVIIVTVIVGLGVVGLALWVAQALTEDNLVWLCVVVVTTLAMAFAVSAANRAARLFAGVVLIVGALRNAADGHWCTEGELTEATGLSLERARLALGWLVTHKSRRLPVLSQLQRELHLVYTLAPAGVPWAERVLRATRGL